jgi:hypothetical protein
MKKLILGAVFALLAACGGGGDDDVTLDPDANSGPDAAAACDPVAQTGCADNEKCTWIRVTDTLGRLGCSPDGTVAAGADCTRGPNGDTTGYDDCAAGNLCVEGVCRAQCVDGACPSGSTCTRIPGHSAEIPACVADTLRE